MRNRFLVGIGAGLLLLSFGGTLCAQKGGPNPGMRPGAPGQQGGPGGRMFEQFRYTFKLMRTVNQIPELEKSKGNALTKAQAKQILAILQPLRSKPKLTSAQAKAASDKLDKIFTKKQREALANMRPSFGRPGPGGPGGPRPGMGNSGRSEQNGRGIRPQGKPGGEGRQPGPNGERRRPGFEKDMNPFYAKASASDPGRERMAKRMNEAFSALKKKANGK